MNTHKKQPILIMFGGISPEHEVSVISGLQIVENIDRTQYTPLTVFFSKTGEIEYLGDIQGRKEFLRPRRESASFGRDNKGGYLQLGGLLKKKIYPYAVCLAFHGGLGECGSVQGLLETMGIPFTSASSEGSVITMNKQITKDLVTKEGILTVPGICLHTIGLRNNLDLESKRIIKELGLPVIVKPAHLGSSIGINVAHSEVELQKYMAEAAQIDTEVLVEKFLQKFVEYNCSVRLVHGQLGKAGVLRVQPVW